MTQNVLEHNVVYSQQIPRLPQMNLAKENTFSSLGTNIKSLKVKQKTKFRKKSSKTELRNNNDNNNNNNNNNNSSNNNITTITI